MADKKELPTYDFFSISMEDISNFLEANASPAEIDEFFANAYVDVEERIMVPDVVITKDGRTIQKMTKLRKKDKATNKSVVVLDDNGNPVMVPKKKAVAVKDGKITKKYSHREAVKWFIEKYADCKPPKVIITNRPMEGTKKKKTADDVFAKLRAKAKAE